MENKKPKCVQYMAKKHYYDRYLTHHLTLDGIETICGQTIPDDGEEVAFRRRGLCSLCTSWYDINYDNEFQSKFSSIGDVYTDIEKFVYWLAHRNVDDENPMMTLEDLMGELFLEIAKGMEHYKDKPHDELLTLLRRMCDNRIAELRYKYYVTSRRHSKITISIDVDETCEMVPTREGDPEALALSKERVELTRSRLSPVAQRVFDALINGDDRCSWLFWLSCTRAVAGGKPHSRPVIKPWIVAEALGEDERSVKAAMSEIRNVYASVGG